MTDPHHVSSLSEALSKRERKVYFFPVDFMVFPGKRVHGIGIRVATKAEDDAAIVEAHKYATKLAGESGSSAANDPDLLTDAKTVEALYRVCREVDTKSIEAHPDDPLLWRATEYAAFRGPSIIRERLSTDEIAHLLNLYIEVKRRENPGAATVSDDAIEALADLCSQHVEDDLPEAVLARYSRPFLTHAVVLLSAKLKISRETAETLLQDVEAREGITAAEIQRLRAIEEAAKAVVEGSEGTTIDALRLALQGPEDAPAEVTTA